MRFMEKYDELYILLLILLFYFIYRLQPFNMSLFLSLLYYYSAAANTLMFNNVNLTNLSKKIF